MTEEIGKVSDDEEKHGDYQSARTEAWKFLDSTDNGDDVIEDWQKTKVPKNAHLDEYASARIGYGKAKWNNHE